ncbi:MAG: terminase small subunit [Burkholderiales bacterium]|nr:terminase small subunit [Burkholderiales bacterium]
MKNEHGLTPQREAYAVALASGLSQADAYRKAYPKAERWKDETVWQAASRLSSDSKVRARVQAIQAAAAEKAGLRAAEILEETRRIALSTPKGIIGRRANGQAFVLMPNELDDATAAAIASFEIDDMGRIKYRFWDKNAALERAAKILGLFGKDNEQKANGLVTLYGRLTGSVFQPVPEAALPESEGEGDKG